MKLGSFACSINGSYGTDFLLGAAFLGLVCFEVWLVAVALFQTPKPLEERILWAVGCFFVPVIAIIFVCRFWHLAKWPFIIGSVALTLAIAPVMMVVFGLMPDCPTA